MRTTISQYLREAGIKPLTHQSVVLNLANVTTRPSYEEKMTMNSQWASAVTLASVRSSIELDIYDLVDCFVAY